MSQTTSSQSDVRPALIPFPSNSSFAAVRRSFQHFVIQRLGSVTVAAVASVLNLYRLNDTGYSNLYYAASVRSMMFNWHNFFYVSFDPGGFISVDKPPLGLWMQVIFAETFGYSSTVLLLPQAIAGIASTLVLYHLVNRTWGKLAGTVAGLALAITPINAITSRNNTVDSQLLLVLLLATWAVIIATERASRKWLLVGFALVGIGFNIKMLQAFLVLPSLYLLYALGSSGSLRNCARDLTIASVVLGIVSLTWVAAVDLTPQEQRPYVGASGNNHVLSLVMEHNGAARLVGSPGTLQGYDIGAPGPLRLLQPHFAGQVNWFLPLALAGLIVLLKHRPWSFTRIGTRERQAVLLWGSWLIVLIVFFSTISFFHIYYLVVLSPAVAALTGIGIKSLFYALHRPGLRALLLPGTLLITLLFHAWILLDDRFWFDRLVPILLSCVLGSAIVLALSSSRFNLARIDLRAMAATVLIVSVFVGPATWSAIPVLRAHGTTVPIAGPASVTDSRMVSKREQRIDPAGLAYLQTHHADEMYFLATLTSFPASPFVVATGKPVMALGGWKGKDDVLSLVQMQHAVEAREVRFFLVSPGRITPPDRRTFAADVIGDWVRDECVAVPEELWRSTPPVDNAWSSKRLFDCRTLRDTRLAPSIRAED